MDGNVYYCVVCGEKHEEGQWCPQIQKYCTKSYSKKIIVCGEMYL